MLSSACTRRRLLVGFAALALAACSGTDSAATTSSFAPNNPSTAASSSAAAVTATSAAATAAPPSTSTTTTQPPTTTSSTLPALGAASTPHRVPIGDGVHFSYGRTHHDYPASDIFAGCGAPVVSPVNGWVLEVRGEDGWTAKIDNPATRGGRSVAILGDDGVRYYLAHFEQIDPGLTVGLRVAIGDPLGTQGRTGRASACHTHFAISPWCLGREWSVRRGVIWPWGYLDAWRRGVEASPVEEVQRWLNEHPNGCAEAIADPYAADS